LKKNLIVIDTNVLISSLIGQPGYPRKIFEELVSTNKIIICVSKAVFQEYEEVLQRDKFKKYQSFTASASILLKIIKEQCLWYEPQLTIDILDDKDDNMFIELAVEAEAGYIVTGNTNDFIIKTYKGISICSPKEFYDSQTSI
jgi:putative PIN family toxin of toxin-antitoxin system